MRPADSSNKSWRRRDVIKLLGATAIAGPALLRGSTANAATSRVIEIGHVSPQSGALAPFAEADSFILSQIRAALAKGIINGGVTYEVQIISKDSQSNTNRASEVAADLILKDKVDLLVASSTPETTNPVADQAEANETPALRIMLPGSPTSLVDTAHRTKVSLGHIISFGARKTWLRLF
jgi:branched-chain amino acid transport system substrate-binding protein